MICAIYTRKSKEEAKTGNTGIGNQRLAAERLVLAHEFEGWSVCPTSYDDDGYSGGSDTRPAYQRLLADAQAGLFECVVVHKVDRFTRSLLHFVEALQTLNAAGVSFVSVTEGIDTSTPHGRLMLNMLATFAQFERERIGERFREKLGALKAQGLAYTGRVYGHSKRVSGTGGATRKELVPEQTEQQAIAQMQAMRKGGASLQRIADELTLRGLPTPRGGTEWSRQTVAYILERT